MSAGPTLPCAVPESVRAWPGMPFSASRFLSRAGSDNEKKGACDLPDSWWWYLLVPSWRTLEPSRRAVLGVRGSTCAQQVRTYRKAEISLAWLGIAGNRRAEPGRR